MLTIWDNTHALDSAYNGLEGWAIPEVRLWRIVSLCQLLWLGPACMMLQRLAIRRRTARAATASSPKALRSVMTVDRAQTEGMAQLSST